jgi:predicted aspartyl protease
VLKNILAVPVRRTITGHLLVRTRSDNGDCLEFLVDSGASQTVIAASSPALERKTFVPLQTEVSAEAAGGTIVGVQQVKIELLEFGRWSFSEIDAVIMELSHLKERLNHEVDGILGLDVLSRNGFWLDLTENSIFFSFDVLN